MQNGRPVRKRDIPILARVLCCIQDARHGEDACAFIEDRLTSITSRLTGMPRGNSSKGGLDEAYAKLEEAGERYAAKLEKALGSTECAQVKPAFFDPETRCLAAVKAACNVLEAQMTALR